MSERNIYPRSGPTRGFHFWLREYENFRSTPREVDASTFTRQLFNIAWVYRKKGKELHPEWVRYGKFNLVGHQYHGYCCWCRQPCEPRKVWHTDCVKAMLVAKGLVVDVYQRPLIPKGPCTDCGLAPKTASGRPSTLGLAIDHKVALSVAWEYRRIGRRDWWRAWTVANLQWLCLACHSRKTALDMRLLSDLRRGQRRLAFTT